MEGQTVVTESERAVLREVLQALRKLSHGSIEVIVQDGRVVQIDTTEKRRLDRDKG
jgi:hypothetical protein